MSNKAKFVRFRASENLDLPLATGQSFQVTWRLRNSGQTSWNNQIRFTYSRGSLAPTIGHEKSPLNGRTSFSLIELGVQPPIQPGEEVDLTLNLTTPEDEETYVSHWQLQDGERRFFGPLCWTRVRVRNHALRFISFDASKNLDKISPGETFEVSWSVQNIGSLDWSQDNQFVLDSGRSSTEKISEKSTFSLADITSDPNASYGEIIRLRLKLQAPDAPGHYKLHWQMGDSAGKPFGPRLWVDFDVIKKGKKTDIGMNVGHFEETWRQTDLPQIESLLLPFSVVRFMDWQKTNALFGSGVHPGNYTPAKERLETKRPLPTEDWRYPGKGPWSFFKGVPLEVIINTANKVDVRPWICIPHLAHNVLINEIIRFTLINANRPPIFEYSNELWNAGFKQYHDAAALGQVDLTDDELEKMEISRLELTSGNLKRFERKFVIIWQARRSIDLARRVEDYLSNSRNRVRNPERRADVVAGSQRTVPWHTQMMLRLCGQSISAVAIAPYLGNNLGTWPQRYVDPNIKDWFHPDPRFRDDIQRLIELVDESRRQKKSVPSNHPVVRQGLRRLLDLPGTLPTLEITPSNDIVQQAIKSYLLRELEGPFKTETGRDFDVLTHLREHKQHAERVGAEVWGYEGGLHLRGDIFMRYFAEFNRSEEAGEVTKALIDRWSEEAGGVLCLYNLASRFGTEPFGHYELKTVGKSALYTKTAKYSELF